MSDNKQLEQAVDDLRLVERRLVELVEQTELIGSAGAALDEARASLGSVQAGLSETASRQSDLAGELSHVAGVIADAVEVIRKGDPASVLTSIQGLEEDFDRYKERLSEMAGELKARIEASELKSESALEQHQERLVEALDERSVGVIESVETSAQTVAAALNDASQGIEEISTQLKRLGRRVFWLSLLDLAIGAAIVGLVVFVLSSI